MFWLRPKPGKCCCPDVDLRIPTATSWRWNAPWTNVLRDVHVLLFVVSQSSNSFIGKMPDCRSRWIVFAINCCSEYELQAMIATTWHFLTCKSNNLGASLGKKKTAWNILSSSHSNNPPGYPNVFSNCVNIDWILIVGLHPISIGLLDTLNWSGMFSSSIQKHARLMLMYER